MTIPGRLLRPAPLLATWFGVGRLSKAPGTWGSLAALPLAWLLLAWGGAWFLLAGAAAVLAMGMWAAGVYMHATGRHDPGEIVIDEVAGQLVALLPVAAAEPWFFLAGFLLFRVFDIVKPWPIGWADRRVPGAAGVMLDDVLAGVYVCAILYSWKLIENDGPLL